MGKDGIIASTSALSILLYEGIGDTISIFNSESDKDQVNEVFVCKEILSSLNLRKFKLELCHVQGADELVTIS